MPNQPLIAQIFSRNMLICIFTGFSSGLPLYVLTQLVPAWLTSNQVDIKTIGFFTLTSFPYTWKFLIAPLLDRYYPNFLGRRRSWMFLTQITLFGSIILLGLFNPAQNIQTVAIIATAIAIFSAVQDIVIDAYRREIIFTALYMLPGLFLSLFLSREPKVPEIDRSVPFYQTFSLPFKEFFSRKGIAAGIGLILFIFLYKFGDSLATSLQTKFILDMGFSNSDIGTVVKINSLWASIVSGICGGILMLKLGINRSLWLFGFVQFITILGFVWMAGYGKFETIGTYERFVLTTVIIGEYIGVGLGTAAFVAFMARETNPLYTATQLAIFTSLSAIPSKLIGAYSGVFVSHYGYYTFFWLCFILAIPGMICLFWVAPWNNKAQDEKIT